MPSYTLYGKRLLCYTVVDDFIDIQGIGGDPLYKRFDSVYSVIDKCIPEEYKSFLAHPIFSNDEGNIQWYVGEWNTPPQKYSDLDSVNKDKYSLIKDKTKAVYAQVINTLSGEDRQILMGATKYIDDDFIFCYDDKVVVMAWGMTPDSSKHVIKGAVIHDLKIKIKRKVYFIPGEHGDLKDKVDEIMYRENGSVLTRHDIPQVIAHEGYEFKSWTPDPIGVRITKDYKFQAVYDKLPEKVEPKLPPISVPPVEENIKVEFKCSEGGYLSGAEHIELKKGEKIPLELIPVPVANIGWNFDDWDKPVDMPIMTDTIYTAKFVREFVNYKFQPGEFGTIENNQEYKLPYGAQILKEHIPTVIPKKGYKFIGWDKSPVDYILEGNVVFTAQYEKEDKLPLYKRVWAGVKGKGCLKWLLLLLLLILLLVLFSVLIKECNGREDNVEVIEKIETPEGDVIDNNGPIKGIVGEDGTLPDNAIVAPIVGDDGTQPPIIENPGAPDIISNRLNIFFESIDVDLDAFADDLAKIYTESQCVIIGADRNIPMIQIMIQESMRDLIRENLNRQLPNYDFFVVDESIFHTKNDTELDRQNGGWHLKAINLREAWNYTQGSPNIIVAVVDDGIDAKHKILKNKITMPYNVFTQDNRLSHGYGHGTHVAGLAVGSDIFFDKGISGVAPRCKLMPVQVFDNGFCTFSSLTRGIMYAVNNGADVVNVSIGPDFNGLDVLPVSYQDCIAKTKFKNEEKVWQRIVKVANEHNSIIVFAVGNDNILAVVPPENRIGNTVNVAAVSKDYEGTDFTNWGLGSNISAPGKEIISSIPNDNFAILDGTSMAAPIVSGAVALMKSQNEDITVEEVIQILQKTGRVISEYIPPMIQLDAALYMQRTGENLNQQPGMGGSQPGGGGPQPGMGGSLPGSGGQQPGMGGSQPGGGDQQPGMGGSQPGSGGPQPGMGGSQPGSGGQQPGMGGSQPGGGDQQPGMGGSQPGGGGQQPGMGGSQPGSGGQQPGMGGSQPGSGGQQPGMGGSQPGGGDQQPGMGGSQPGSGGQQPGMGGSQPGSETDYDYIRKLIEAYKKKIKELEKLLPENQ